METATSRQVNVAKSKPVTTTMPNAPVSKPSKSKMLAKGTRIATSDGIFTIGSLLGTVFHVPGITGNRSVAQVEPCSDENKSVYRVTTRDGNSITCTGDVCMVISDEHAKDDKMVSVFSNRLQ